MSPFGPCNPCGPAGPACPSLFQVSSVSVASQVALTRSTLEMLPTHPWIDVPSARAWAVIAPVVTATAATAAAIMRRGLMRRTVRRRRGRRVSRGYSISGGRLPSTAVSVVKINAITVPKEGGDELAQRFANRIGAVDQQDGFEEFQLLRPADERETWLVYTRWRDEESFLAWVNSPAFQHGHRGPQQAAEEQKGGDVAKPPPAHIAMSSELWQFTVEQKTEARA